VVQTTLFQPLFEIINAVPFRIFFTKYGFKWADTGHKLTQVTQADTGHKLTKVTS